MEEGRTGKSTSPMAPPGIHHYAFEAGHVLGGRFELLEPLGYGGVGEVYRALDRSLHEEVAIKVVFNASLRAVYLDRVRREVTVARNLSHPNILKYYDLHEFPDGPGLSMELVYGRTLQQKLDDAGPLSEDAIRSFLVQIVEALEHLHQNGLIHRDIKPSNIFLTKDGTVKLGDFGIVHVEAAEGLTLTGETLGTPTYMSPEQIQCKPLTPASDFYSLGVTLHEIVSGKVPFEGTYGEVASAHLSKPPPTLTDLPLSGRLKRLILGLLEKNPVRRWTGAELRRYLERKRLPFLPGRRRALLVSAAVAAVAMTMGLAGVSYWRPTEPTRTEFHDRTVTCYHQDRLLWEKTFPLSVNGALLYDTDGDGEKEVIVGFQRQPLPENSPDLEIPVYEGSGEPAIPLRLRVQEFREAFDAFSPNYTVTYEAKPIFSPEQDDLIISFRHECYYPASTFIRSAENGKIVFQFGNPGYQFDMVRWKDGLAFHAGNAPFFHMEALALTSPCGPQVAPVSVLIGLGLSDGWQAYHLLENRSTTKVEMGDPIQVILSDGLARHVLEDGSLEGQKPGAGTQTVKGIFNYYHVLEHFRNERLDQADALIRDFGKTAREFGLTGYEVLYGMLDAERLARLGRWDEAESRCWELAKRFPNYAAEAPLWAALYRYLRGDYAGAKRMWLDQPDIINLRANKQWEMYTYVVFGSILEGASSQSIEEDVDSSKKNIPPATHWANYLDFQKGWILLLKGDPAGAKSILYPALKQGGFEPHAAGYFLSRLADGTFDMKELDAYAGKVGGNPVYMKWIRAVGKGDDKEAASLWQDFENEAFHNQESALMLPLIKKTIQVYPHAFPK